MVELLGELWIERGEGDKADQNVSRSEVTGWI
jgi:hypothetical protein